MYAVKIKDVNKSYYLGKIRETALRDININISPQCFTVLSGKSGSGKTTLLNLIGGLDTPDNGEIIISGQKMNNMNDNQRSTFRQQNLGFIFQNFNLIPVLTAYENIEIPLILRRMAPAQRRREVTHMLECIGMDSKLNSLPNQLSGGQRQRVAIARALIHQPKLVLADEPTANLDSKTSESVLQLLRTLQTEYKTSVVFSSHDPMVIEQADDIFLISDGIVTSKPGVSG